MGNITERVRERLQQLPHRAVAVLATGAALGITLIALALTLNVVIVTDSYGARKTLITSAKDPEAILSLAGMEAGEYDDVFYTSYRGNTTVVNIQRAFPVSVQADGQTYTAYLSSGTVNDALCQLNIQMAATDYSEPSLHAQAEEGAGVSVHRVLYQDTVTQEAVPSPVTYKLSSLVRGSRTYTLQQGTPGANEVTYRQRLVDGQLESAQVVSVVEVLAPTETVVLKRGDVPVSGLDGPAVVNNAPASYSRLISGAVCAGYSSSGGRGASGLGLYAGTVAVNPNEIPYGSKLFITSADGSFVYGYAIATDTGTALMNGVIDLDLYYDTYLESVLNGKKVLNVYVL